jgi:hypothetical protein
MGSGSADGGVSRAAALGFPKGWGQGQSAIRACGRALRFCVPAFPRLRVLCIEAAGAGVTMEP